MSIAAAGGRRPPRFALPPLPAHLDEPGGDGPAARLFAAARALFAAAGYEAASTRAIAERAGLNQALVHYYFGSKAALYRRVLAVELHKILRHQAEGRLGVLPVADLLATFPARMLDFFRAHPETARLLRREVGAEGRVIREIVVELGMGGPLGLRRRLAAAQAEGVAAGRLRDLPADHLLACLLAMSYGMVLMEPMISAVFNLDLGRSSHRGLAGSIESLLRHGLIPPEDK